MNKDKRFCDDCLVGCHYHHLDPYVAPGPCECEHFVHNDYSFEETASIFAAVS